MASKVILEGYKGALRAEVDLPYSKSILNRILAIHSFQDEISLPSENLPEDVKVFCEMLNRKEGLLDAGHAGTALRFGTAVAALKPGKWTITGSSRMKQRPVKWLVEALWQLGAYIKYLEREGFPPLAVTGKKLLCNQTIEIPGNISSQYISALLMIGPYVQNGLQLKIREPVLSRPYIDMTVELMRRAGAIVSQDGNYYEVEPKPYTVTSFKPERDWSSASYFLAQLFAQGEGEVFFPSLERESLQGDSKICDWFESNGMEVSVYNGGLLFRLSKGNAIFGKTEAIDFAEMPDMVQTFAVLFLKKEIGARFSGCDNLNLKETNRLDKLRNLVLQCGGELLPGEPGELNFNPPSSMPDLSKTILSVYGDHRMAMSQSILACNGQRLQIENPKVVEKSFPSFWKELRKTRLKVSFENR
ncbi:MAG: 3-phosphoshikimate 1-carboxyvinyltransferase [Saprospirales bacterium]|nr:MAG: 3-phosphoshikimate 1-carboxyvinyltransferase [Saprospirales bacterium]